MRKFLLGFCTLMALGSCASTARVRTDDLKLADLRASDPAKIAVFSTADAGGREFQVLGQVIASADAGNDADIAVEKLKEEAAEMGADAVVLMRLEGDLGYWNNAIKATATAVKYK
ncbi:MAG: heavy metal-binding domain-containing protein [Fibrobacteres bacterium]|nr:heavy metal-binding domain-containing protein [Fibrobacterota bacterium]